MSKHIGEVRSTGSRNVTINITRYYGGAEVGTCYQLSAIMEEGPIGYIQVTKKDLEDILEIVEDYI